MNLHKMLEPLRRRMATLIGRCVLAAIAPGHGVQSATVNIMADEVMSGVEYLEPYGVTSVPHPGAEGLVLNVAGQRGACVAVALGNRNLRLRSLKTGEVAIYTDEGDKIELLRGRRMALTTLHCTISAAEDVTVNTKRYVVTATEGVQYATPAFGLGGGTGEACAASITANMTVTGGIASTGDQIAGGISQIAHVHSGIQPGDADTGAPKG